MIFNDFFVNIVPNLGINTENDFLNTTNISHNPIENAVYKYDITYILKKLFNLWIFQQS